jgi:hypothetical protein
MVVLCNDMALVQFESDFLIAQNYHLLPDTIAWDMWLKLNQGELIAAQDVSMADCVDLVKSRQSQLSKQIPRVDIPGAGHIVYHLLPDTIAWDMWLKLNQQLLKNDVTSPGNINSR